jgi:hypothetical protein
MDKLMENDKAVSHELTQTLIHPLTTFRRSKQMRTLKRLRRNNNNIFLK